MASLFTKIINRELPAQVVAEDDQFIAFLDIMPLTMGHTLVVPKKELDYIFDHDNATLEALIVFAKKVAVAMKKAVPCKRVGVAVIGLEVPHTHVHLVPMNTMDDINFTRPKLKPTQEELAATAKKIKEGFAG
ncbi:MAG TPA: HIT family protein [Cyclobacteriaceae bacterium]|nr:HIT family protein [Cyclobacteriaceae bacterium]MCB9238793.1 HIT family protein [Flammeovirgaceae bacterium]MCB0498069.1 HIT family protein [Cyclobacteriaceae bacterium]MCO5270512.1 HIT family protein [Cyclobacteriaceae bacterium]MCW5901047.1 HIT family protein [Cyclobacteriaceae bacterium]